jgi:hypothetical protein
MTPPPPPHHPADGEHSGLSAHTLRYYERVACSGRSSGPESGHRLYRADDAGWIGLITCLRETGMPNSLRGAHGSFVDHPSLQTAGDSGGLPLTRSAGLRRPQDTELVPFRAEGIARHGREPWLARVICDTDRNYTLAPVEASATRGRPT